jgi:SPP1 family predicted phage head-tail adaptor
MQCGAGKRRVRVVCQVASSAAANGSYEVLPTFTSSFERFAEDLKTSGREFTIAMQQVGNLYGIIKLPYDPKTASLTARDRVIIDGSILHIAAPPNNENGQRERIVLWVVQAEGTIQ